MTIGEKIKSLRIKKGLTQKQLGDLCNMADSAIRRYELGNVNPKIETVRKIADALGVSINDLLLDPIWSSSNDSRDNSCSQIKDRLFKLGYPVQSDSEGYMWIRYPDGKLDICMETLTDLQEDTDQYLKFRLEELKRKNPESFYPWK